MQVGDRVTWTAVNKPYSGVVTGKHTLGWKVRLDNGKYVIANEKSLRYEREHQ